MIWKNSSPPNHRFLTTIRPLGTIFNFIKFYLSDLKVLYSLIGPGKGNLIHEDIIFVTPKLCFTKHSIYANNRFS